MTNHGRSLGLRLAATLAPLGEPTEALAWLASNGFGAVQLSAAQPGLRPRELDASARRGFRSLLKRLELEPAGIDLWIPVEHFGDPSDMPRAVDAMHDALALAEFLGRVTICCVLPKPRPVIAPIPGSTRSAIDAASETSPDAARACEARQAIVEEAQRRGVTIADFAADASAEGPVTIGLDLASVAGRGANDVASVARAGRSLGALRVGSVGPDGRRLPIAPGSARAFELIEIRAALDVCGFDGAVVADARAWPDARAGLLTTLAAWRASAPPSHDDAER